MKRQPNFAPGRKLSRAPRPHGFSVVRMLVLLLALGSLAFGAAWLAHRFSPTARLARRTADLAATVVLERRALHPLEIARRLSATESALAPGASAGFAREGGDAWTVEGRRELKDLHARLLAEAPRLWLSLDGLGAVAVRTAPDAIDVSVRADLRLDGETTLRGPLLATLHWLKTPDGWKIHRAEFLLDDLPDGVP